MVRKEFPILLKLVMSILGLLLVNTHNSPEGQTYDEVRVRVRVRVRKGKPMMRWV